MPGKGSHTRGPAAGCEEVTGLAIDHFVKQVTLTTKARGHPTC